MDSDDSRGRSRRRARALSHANVIATVNVPNAQEEKPLNELVDSIEAPTDRYYDLVRVETDKLLELNYYYFPTQVAPYDDPRVLRPTRWNKSRQARSWESLAPPSTRRPETMNWSTLEKPKRRSLKNSGRLALRHITS